MSKSTIKAKYRTSTYGENGQPNVDIFEDTNGKFIATDRGVLKNLDNGAGFVYELDEADIIRDDIEVRKILLEEHRLALFYARLDAKSEVL